MAWNGSTPDVSASSSSKASPKAAPSWLKGALAGLAVVAVGAIAVLFLMSPSDKPDAERTGKSRGQIKEAKPAQVPAKQASPVEKTKKRRVPGWASDSTNGLTAVQLRQWRYFHNPPPYTNVVTTAPAEFAIFPTRAENEIACLMSLEPGETLVGDGMYGERFEKEFLKSCEVPIIASDEDTPYQRQLKEDMIKMKIELRQRMADGESLSQILQDTRKEIMRMSQIKQDMVAELRTMVKENAQTEADIDDCVAAANKLLERKGIAPIKVNPITRKAMVRAVQAKNKQH